MPWRCTLMLVAPVALYQRVAVHLQQHRNLVRPEQGARGQGSGPQVQPGEADIGVTQFHVFHQVVQGDVSAKSAEPQQQGGAQPKKGGQRLVAKGGVNQVEPHYVGLQFAGGGQQAPGCGQAVEPPAAPNAKTIQLRQARGILIGQHDDLGMLVPRLRG